MLHIFDMDGTLLPNTTGLLEIAHELHTTDELLALEKRYITQEITPKEVARLIFELWGIIPAATIQQAFDNAPKLKHIREVVNDIHNSGGLAAVITLSADFFANHFLEYGFDRVYASQFPKDTHTPFNPDLILDSDAKPLLAKKLHEDKNLGNPVIVAYGDSHSDVPMFKQAAISVSVNGDHYLEQLATYHYTGDDLWEAYKLVRNTLEPQKEIG